MKDFQQLVNNGVITQLNIDQKELDKIGEMKVEEGVSALIKNEIITQVGMVDWTKKWWNLKSSEKATILLIDKEGLEYTKEEYLAAYDEDPDIKSHIEGILVKLKEIEFVVSKIHNTLPWFDVEKLSELKGVTTKIESWAAVGDLAGVNNTTAIDQALGKAAQEYASQFCTKNKGYLPSEGELWTAYNNREEIDDLLKLVGGSGSNMGDVWLSSTQYDKDKAWAMNLRNGEVTPVYKGTALHVKPFMKYSPAKTVTADEPKAPAKAAPATKSAKAPKAPKAPKA